MYSKVQELDKFYTPDSLALECCKKVLEVVPDALELEWLEPAAGGGAFVRAFQALGVPSWEAWDVEPDNDLEFKCEQVDFLALQPRHLHGGVSLKGKMVVTNPPFGKRLKLSNAFVNKALELGVEYVAVLTLASAMKNSVKKSIHPKAHLVFEEFLGSHGFSIDGGREVLRPKVCLQVWKLGSKERAVKPNNWEAYFKPVKTLQEFNEASIWINYHGNGVKPDWFKFKPPARLYTSLNELLSNPAAFTYKIGSQLSGKPGVKLSERLALAGELEVAYGGSFKDGYGLSSHIVAYFVSHEVKEVLKAIWPLAELKSVQSMITSLTLSELTELLDQYFADPKAVLERVEALKRGEIPVMVAPPGSCLCCGVSNV